VRPPHGPLHDRQQEPIGLGDRAMVSIEAQVVSVEAEDAHVVRSAEARGAPDHRVEHGLQVRGRAADHPQDLARRSLLLERFGHLRMGLGERPVLLLQLREQADVLDGDHGLVGEMFEQLDELIWERCRIFARHSNETQSAISADHRDHQPGSVTRKVCVFDIAGGGVGVVLDIRQMDHVTLSDGLCRVYFGAERYRILGAKSLHSIGPDSMGRGHSEHVPVDDEHRAAQGRTDADPASGDRLEDRLRVGRRAPDDTQNLTGRPFARQSFAQAPLQFRIRRL
jgi:hypothetical protein